MLLKRHADEVTEDGCRRQVRHGHLPEREIVTGMVLLWCGPLFATGLGALGMLGWRRKRRARGAA